MDLPTETKKKKQQRDQKYYLQVSGYHYLLPFVCETALTGLASQSKIQAWDLDKTAFQLVDISSITILCTFAQYFK